MKRIFYLLCFLVTMLVASCCSPESDEPVKPVTISERTVIAYITGDNNLYRVLADDLKEMVAGSANLDTTCNLIALVDMLDENPYIAEIKKGKMTKVRSFSNDFYTTSADSMLSIYKWIIDKYPAREYATIIAGHGSGPVIAEKDTIPTTFVSMGAYYYDVTGTDKNKKTATYMNIPSMAAVFSRLPKMAYIFFDCCSMQSAELAYELRNAADYIVAPVSETHVSGAPYKEIIPLISKPKDVVGKEIVDAYVEYGNFGSSCGVCLSVVRTDKMEALLNATRNALASLYDGTNRLELPFDHTIYYFRSKATNMDPILHDIKAVMKNNLTATAFDEWLPYLNAAVVYKEKPAMQGDKDLWTTTKDPVNGPNINFNTFRDAVDLANNYYDDDHYGGMSIIIPYAFYDEVETDGYTSVNKLMYKLDWCNKVGWKSFGW